MSGVRLAFVAANPRELSAPLRQTDELQRVRDAIHESPLSRRIAVIETLAATLPKLQKVIREARPEVLHFSGFEASPEGGIMLEDADGYGHPLSTAALVELFRAARYSPRLLLLNCCKSNGTAKALSKHALAAIGYEGDVADDVATVFSDSLYRRVFAREPLATAFAGAAEIAAKHPTAVRAEREAGLLREPARLFLGPKQAARTYLAVDLQPFSVFISYGGLDQKVAERLHDAFEAAGFDAFVFSKDARAGQPLHELMFQQVNRADRIVLLCSRSSLGRPGVLNEIEEVLRRAAREGGRSALVPLALDDFVFGELLARDSELGARLGDLTIADFRGVQRSAAKFTAAFERLARDLSGEG
jgi:hypothetical protein